MILASLLLALAAAGLRAARFVLQPSATIQDRHSVKARLFLPPDIRDFPIEKYAGPDDRFVYAIAEQQGGWQLSMLTIDAPVGRLPSYKDAFRQFLATRGVFQERGAGRRRTFLFRSNANKLAAAMIVFEPDPQARRAKITFQCHRLGRARKFLRTRPGRLLAALFRKVWPTDATTCPS